MILELISTYGYVALVPLFMFEGMITGLVAGTLASFGIFNPYIVILVYVMSKSLADTFVYVSARYGMEYLNESEFAKGVIDRLTTNGNGENKEWTEFLNNNFMTYLFISKVAPIPMMDVALLIAAGTVKISIKRVWVGLFLGQPLWSAGIVMLGYYFGDMILEIKETINATGFVLFITILLLFLYYRYASHYIYKHSKIGELMNREN